MALIDRRLNPIPSSWSGSKRTAGWVLAVLIAGNVAFLAVTLAWPQGIQRLTTPVIPRHYVSQFDADPLGSYEGTHGIAHNSGDSLSKIASAVDAGAHGIEIDVIIYRGDLYARHNQPVTVFGEFGFRPVLLEEAWQAATTELVQLDLKDNSPPFLDRVASFLDRHQNDRRIVLVSSWEPVVLAYFQERTPWVGRLLSVGTQTSYDDLRAGIDVMQLNRLLNGVTIVHDLLDRGTVAWLKQRDLLVFAWTVENLSRVNELSLLGVDAVVTGNLSILNLLRDSQENTFEGTPIAAEATPPALASPVAAQPTDAEPETSSDDQSRP